MASAAPPTRSSLLECLDSALIGRILFQLPPGSLRVARLSCRAFDAAARDSEGGIGWLTLCPATIASPYGGAPRFERFPRLKELRLTGWTRGYVSLQRCFVALAPIDAAAVERIEQLSFRICDLSDQGTLALLLLHMPRLKRFAAVESGGRHGSLRQLAALLRTGACQLESLATPGHIVDRPAAEALSQLPKLSHFTLTVASWRELAALPSLLALEAPVSAAELACAAALTRLQKLRLLLVYRAEFEDAGFPGPAFDVGGVLAALASMPRLEALSLQGLPIAPLLVNTGSLWRAGRAPPPRLRTLEVTREPPLPLSDVRQLALLPGLPSRLCAQVGAGEAEGLEELALQFERVGGKRIEASCRERPAVDFSLRLPSEPGN